MKFFYVCLLFIANSCFAQQWQAGVMLGASGYNGDLTRHTVSLKTFGPAISADLKYFLPGKYIGLRASLSYGLISGSDKNNKDLSIVARNLNFKTHILEGSFGAELNLLDPDGFNAYPYLYAGVGILHFDPYTHDNNNNKVFLRSLGTEGQGLEEYPDRKMYSLTQFCIPIGGGWKWKINDTYELSYELAVRYLFTDYLDDVSTTYVNPETLRVERGRLAVALANREINPPAIIEGRQRGNPKVKDFYYMTGFKLAINLGEVVSD